MRLTMPQIELIQALQLFSRESRELRQLVRRLKEVLPRRLENCKQSATGKGAKKERLALTSSDYIQACKELVEMDYSYTHSLVQWETHRMLYAARQSQRLYQQALLRHKR